VYGYRISGVGPTGEPFLLEKDGFFTHDEAKEAAESRIALEWPRTYQFEVTVIMS